MSKLARRALSAVVLSSAEMRSASVRELSVGGDGDADGDEPAGWTTERRCDARECGSVCGDVRRMDDVRAELARHVFGEPRAVEGDARAAQRWPAVR